jgi:hypothetical protein
VAAAGAVVDEELSVLAAGVAEPSAAAGVLLDAAELAASAALRESVR